MIFADAEELVEAVLEKRNFEGNHTLKIMADGGQGFFKISMTILPENHEAAETLDDRDFEISGPVHRKRTRYSEGGTTGQENKITTVQRLILVCIVPDIKETYENLKILFDLTKINNISFRFTSDFKLILIVNGLQTATSTFPCPYCFVTLNELRNPEKKVGKKKTKLYIDNIKNKLKTYGDLKKCSEEYRAQGSNKKEACAYYNTINSPLFEEKDDTLVLEKCVIP